MSNGFSIGSAALKSVTSAIDVTSKNIAASNVSGYKFKEYLFQESISRSQLSDSPAPILNPGFERRNYAQGKLQNSNSELDMAVDGNGFFTVGLREEPVVNSTYFTRAGSFTYDKDGFIRTPSGLYLYGYTATPDGKDVNNEQKVSALKVPTSLMAPKQTSLGELSLNFDSRKPQVSASSEVGSQIVANNVDPENPDSYSSVYRFKLIDQTGQEHSVGLYFRRISANIYDAYVNVDNQRWASGDASGEDPLSIQMPNEETPTQLPSERSPVARFGFSNSELVVVGSADLSETELDELSSNNEAKNLKLNFNILPPTANPLVETNVFTAPLAFSLDFKGSNHTATGFGASKATQDGYKAGALKSVSVDSSGVLSADFDNDQTRVLGQVRLASFQGLNGLKEVTNNTYSTSLESGNPSYAKPGQLGLGEISPKYVELSNVNLTDELVKLVVFQQSYASNARSIQVQSEVISRALDATG